MGNHIDNEGAKALANALAQNGSLVWLELSHNGIKDDGARALAEMLRENRTLARLGLGNFLALHAGIGRNGVGDEGAKEIADAIRKNGGSLRVLNIGTIIAWRRTASVEGKRMEEEGRRALMHVAGLSGVTIIC